MIIWKSLVGECLKCVKERTNEKDKNAVSIVRINSHYKKQVVGHVQAAEYFRDCMPYCTLDIFAIGICVNHGCEYGLEIPKNFHFYEPEKAIKLAQKIK